MCNCIAEHNEALASMGVQLVIGFRFASDMSSVTTFIPVPLEKIDKANRKVKLPTLMPNYCVFCGEVISTSKE